MKVGIHQPNYIPWIGYFYKIYKSEIFVFLDDVQYEKNGFSDRNSIKTPQGKCYLKIPVELPNSKSSYNNVRIKNELGWKEKHLKTLSMNYKKSCYYNEIYSDLEKFYYNDYEELSTFNIQLIKCICSKLNINRTFLLSSELNTSGVSTERLINIISQCNGTTYVSGLGGKNYQDELLFEKNKINIEYLNIELMSYKQLWGEFTPNLSVLDLLFNLGYENTGNIIANL